MLSVKPGKKTPLRKPKCRWYITAKLILKSSDVRMWVGYVWLGYGPTADFCED
jgi:hypothetical protein